MTVNAYLKFAGEILGRHPDEMPPSRCSGDDLCKMLWIYVDQISGPENKAVQDLAVDETFASGLDRKLERWARKERLALPPMLPGERRLFQERLQQMLVVAMANQASNRPLLCASSQMTETQKSVGLVLLYIHGLKLDPAFARQLHHR